MQAQQKKILPQAGSGADTSAGESRPLTVSADRGCPSYSGEGNVLLKCDKPFARSGLLQRTPPKTTTQARTWTDTDQTETEDGISTGDEQAQCRRPPYVSPLTFFSPMVSTPKNRDGKRKKSPKSNKETESLEEKEDRLLGELFGNIVDVNSLVERQGPYKNTANEIKTRLRELQKLCGRVMDVRRMRIGEKSEEMERTPKRAKRVAVVVEDKGTNTSTGGEMEGLEWDDDLGTETDWKEVQSKGKRQKERNRNKGLGRYPAEINRVQDKEKENEIEKDLLTKTGRNREEEKAPNQKAKKKGKNKLGKKPSGRKPIAKPEALLVEVRDRDYASVLKEVKSGLASEKVVFSKVRKTRRGDILLELEKGQDGNAVQVKEKVGELCPNLTLRALKESADVIIRGLDATVEKEEVEEALKQKVKEFHVKSFWENRYGIKTALVELPKEEAQKLADQKKIKIGWMRVPIRLSVERKRCYRCLEYGHISMACPGQDRSKKCYNCGIEGHKAIDCERETACAICMDKGQSNTRHRMGSKSCPSWKEKVPGGRIKVPKNGV
ncbi:uncharacterized protein LOC123877940 [Maniola jurtina]|uniref:uncharacterized protein LOC123877940 n=1 Tax=Maniola jurtina TaxID=191418 RepID=UPI001E68EFDB|nr:uncharacterized protein LOC123877940 [Maniola jurtina]